MRVILAALAAALALALAAPAFAQTVLCNLPGQMAGSQDCKLGSGLQITGNTLATAALPPPTMASTGFAAFTDPQGSYATLSNVANGVQLYDAGNGGDNIIRDACQALPTPPYTITGQFNLTMDWTVAGADQVDNWAGFAWRSTGGALITIGLYSGLINGAENLNLAAHNFTNYDTYAGTDPTAQGFEWASMRDLWLRLQDDGAGNVSIAAATDGVHFIDLLAPTAKSSLSLGSTGFNQICFLVNAKGQNTWSTLETYTVTSP